jgi:hypothetical protein
MSAPIPHAPQGSIPAIGIPDSQDIPRLVYCAPYFQQVPLAELIEPSVIEAVEAALPALVPPYVDQAAQAAVQAQAVLLVGSTMTGPLFLSPLMPSADSQAATKAYVDTMISTAGIPEVPPVPVGQLWGRETGQWAPITPQTGVFLPLAGGTMQGNIAMSGNTINGLASVPSLPNGAAPAQWVLNQIASVSLFQGQWDADTNVPDLTQLSVRVNGYTWIAITTSVSGVVIGQAIPGLQGTTVFNGDTIYYSTVDGEFFAIHAGGLTLPEADARYVQLTGSQMSGALLLNANASQPLQAVTLQQMEAFVPPGVVPEAPNDGQLYGRNGLTASWAPVLPLAGGILTGALTLSGNAAAALNPVPLQQMTSSISAATAPLLPLAGGTMTGLMTLSGNASVSLNPVPLQQLNAMLASYATLTALASYAPLASPTFTGTPAVPTAAAATSTTQAASTAFVHAVATSAVAGYLPLTGGTMTGSITFSGNDGVSTPSGTVNASNLTAAQGTIGGVTMTGGTLSTSNITANIGTIGGVVFAGSQNITAVNSLTATNASVGNVTVGNIIAPASNDAISCGIAGTAWFQVAAYAFAQQSDISDKNNIAPYVPGVSVVSQLLPKTFFFNSDATNTQHLGFVAQDVEGVLPDAVISSTYNNAQGQSVTTLSLDVVAIIAALTNAVKQLISRVVALESNANITPPAADTA